MLPTDLPQTLTEFLARFGTDVGCRDHLFRSRWPDGFRCPACSHGGHYFLTRKVNVWGCLGCNTQGSLLTGTIFEQTKTGLSKWFLAIYLFAGSKGGISALELKHHLGFRSDQTAWTWLHKLRSAMSVRGAPLEGRVEVDETYIGGPQPGKRGRGSAGKALVAGAVETRTYAVVAPDPTGLRGVAARLAEGVAARLAEGRDTVRRCLGRVRLGLIGSASINTLEKFIKSSISPGATIVSDGWNAYRRAASDGYAHERIILSKSVGKAHEHLPGPHLIFNLTKRVLLGTYHGGAQHFHLQAYLDEHTFRFNRRRLAPAMRAMRLIQRALTTLPISNRIIMSRIKSVT